jgi:peroxin-6
MPTIDELNKGPRDTRHPYPMTPQYYLSELATPQEILVTVTHEDFSLALRNLVPSVSQAEMDHYAQVQKRFTQDKAST